MTAGAMTSSSPSFNLSSDSSTTSFTPQSFSASPLPPGDQSHLSPSNVIRPCGACKSLRRRCVPRCVLAPYFPADQPIKFLVVHKIFGSSNIVKFLQELPESQRADAVDCLVYEAAARIKDPVHGCAGEVCRLQKLVRQLQMQLATAEAQLLLNTERHILENFSCHNNSLMGKEMEAEAPQPTLLQHTQLLDEDFMIHEPNSSQINDYSSYLSSVYDSFFPSNTIN